MIGQVKSKINLTKLEWLKKMQDVALSKGGKCLTKEYINSHTKMIWECSEGHTWEANSNNISNGTWCPKCSKKNKVRTAYQLSPEAIKKKEENKKVLFLKLLEIAKSKGGICESTAYVNSKEKLKWICSEGHKWEANPNNIFSGQWCPKCGIIKNTDRQRRPVEAYHLRAKEMGGECLITHAPSSSIEKVKWKCSLGHLWDASGQSVIGSKNWCPECAHQKSIQRFSELRPKKLELLKNIAIERGGECLSDKYIRQNSKLLWRCGNHHEWEAKPSDILQGSWCPSCTGLIGERTCREFFEQLFGQSFPKKKPKWLKSEKDTLFELDGYSEILGLAFEHHGTYHYEIVPPFTNSLADLKKRQTADALKKKICKEHGVNLIEIPEVPTLTPLSKLREVIVGECEKLNISVPFINADINISKAYHPVPVYKELSEIAEKNGGSLVSTRFMGWNYPLTWKCAEGHTWDAVPQSIARQGTWCAICAGVKKKSIDQMQLIARQKGGRCVSTDYVSARNPLIWECSEGHRWEAAPVNIISRKSWCPYCDGQKGAHLSIEFMNEVAVERGGKCLSSNYINSKSKLKWQCKEGHIWDAIPLNVINKKSWCPICARGRQGRKKRDLLQI